MESGPGAHLLPRFVAACRSVGARAPVVDVEGAAMDLLHRWTAPNRGYHDLEHLTEVLAHLDELGADDPSTVLAAWFHDAVYEGQPGADEERSADLAASELVALGVNEDVARRVAELVLVTRDHRPRAGDEAAAQLCDADLAVLAAPRDRYARYVSGVRSEYAHLDDATFRRGRAAVLRGLIERPRLFATDAGRERWEEGARRNVARELTDLER